MTRDEAIALARRHGIPVVPVDPRAQWAYAEPIIAAILEAASSVEAGRAYVLGMRRAAYIASGSTTGDYAAKAIRQEANREESIRIPPPPTGETTGA